MIRLYGADICEPCKQVRRLLTKFGVEHEFIDVSRTDYTGEIPYLELENGAIIIGLPKIAQYIRNIRRQK